MADMCRVGDNGDIPGSYRLPGRGTLCSHRVIYNLQRCCLPGLNSVLVLMGLALVCEETGCVNIPVQKALQQQIRD